MNQVASPQVVARELAATLRPLAVRLGPPQDPGRIGGEYSIGFTREHAHNPNAGPAQLSGPGRRPVCEEIAP